MSDKKKMEESPITKTEIVEGKVDSFLGTYKNILIIIGVAIVALIIVLIIIFKVNNQNLEKSFDQIDKLESTYTEIQAMDKTASDYQTKYDDLKKQLVGLSQGKKYPALKAQCILATMAYEEKDYDTALKGFLAVYEASKNTYLGSLALTDAAVVCEDKGDVDKALEYYTKVWDTYGTKAAESPKALFNQARLQQKKGDATLAKATFQQLIDQFPSSEYAKLAQSVIITL